ncbi:hypothetical protein SUGI_0195700 [Cryptomeria japonica]|uniref:non-specific lipid-transfer protein 1 n=1 Tax=Cryptomeria japonica TaxID=3369 RepID=UPI002408E29B|nr:non-specific lipid-transfer protein 1 [Cryptomeria japonica]GLJ12680.1 hypothetical protein SUGI_0195700 [Cryptomeria japonica]
MVPRKPLAASIIVLLTMFRLFAGAYSEKCSQVSSVLSSCFIALQSGDNFMRAESVCCKSFISLEQIIGESAVSKYEICGCLKGIDGKKQSLFNENLLEVRALCGPNVPFPVTSFSDCTMPLRGTL